MNRANRKNQELNNYKSRRTREYDMEDNHIMNFFKDDFDDPFEDFFSFSGGKSNSIAKQFNALSRFEQDFFSGFESRGNSNMPGSYYQKSYVSTVKYDKDGKPQRETYQSQTIKQNDKDGRRIQESQQAYQNTKTGIEKASHERLLNDKGHKVVRQRNKNIGEQYEHNYFKGMNEGDLPGFDNEYNNYRQKISQNYKAVGDKRMNALPSKYN